MAVHIFRREATYYWRRRTPRALANVMRRPHVFMSLRTTSPVMARRLATQLDAILEDAAMLAENADLHLSRSQIETMLGAVVERHLTKLERVASLQRARPGSTSTRRGRTTSGPCGPTRCSTPRAPRPSSVRRIASAWSSTDYRTPTSRPCSVI